MQKDMKKLIAYSSVSHLGFCTLGIFALTAERIVRQRDSADQPGPLDGGALLDHRVLYEAPAHAADLGIRRTLHSHAQFRGHLHDRHSQLPGLAVAQRIHRRFRHPARTYEVNIKYVAWAVIGIILGAAYLLWLYQRVMFGPVTNPANEHLPDLNAREYATLLPLIILCFWIGIYPKPLFRVLERPCN